MPIWDGETAKGMTGHSIGGTIRVILLCIIEVRFVVGVTGRLSSA